MKFVANKLNPLVQKNYLGPNVINRPISNRFIYGKRVRVFEIGRARVQRTPYRALSIWYCVYYVHTEHSSFY